MTLSGTDYIIWVVCTFGTIATFLCSRKSIPRYFYLFLLWEIARQLGMMFIWFTLGYGMTYWWVFHISLAVRDVLAILSLLNGKYSVRWLYVVFITILLTCSGIGILWQDFYARIVTELRLAAAVAVCSTYVWAAFRSQSRCVLNGLAIFYAVQLTVLAQRALFPHAYYVLGIVPHIAYLCSLLVWSQVRTESTCPVTPQEINALELELKSFVPGEVA